MSLNSRTLREFSGTNPWGVGSLKKKNNPRALRTLHWMKKSISCKNFFNSSYKLISSPNMEEAMKRHRANFPLKRLLHLASWKTKSNNKFLVLPFFCLQNWGHKLILQIRYCSKKGGGQYSVSRSWIWYQVFLKPRFQRAGIDTLVLNFLTKKKNSNTGLIPPPPPLSDSKLTFSLNTSRSFFLKEWCSST